MITAVARLRARPGYEDRVREQALSLVAPTLAEPGCLSYRPYVDPLDPGAWLVFEEWDDRSSFDKHLTSPHMVEAFEAEAELLDGPPTLTLVEG
ncbi:putative quinol monooxygenase [Nonomuraea sp. NPDC050556]|uniref:putative quinol monooxygenase n=1 Tax=Nonomuraea sp. NPDC050556 TaxID=3364369 RepID=UPI00379BD41C